MVSSQSNSASQAYPAPGQPTPTELNPIVEEYAKALGLPYEEAYRRLDIEAQYSEIISRIVREEPTYAGSWMEHTPELRFFVAFAAPDPDAKLQPYLKDIAWASLVEAKQARLSLSELEILFALVRRTAEESQLSFTSSMNLKEGKILISTPDPAAIRSQFMIVDDIRPNIDVIDIIQQKDMLTPATDEEHRHILNNRWRLSEAFQREQPLPFESLTPVFVSFEYTHMAIRPSHCNFLRVALFPDDMRRYRWGESVSTAMDCPLDETAQQDTLYNAFIATNAYELRQDQLIMTGPDVRIVLVVDNTPPTPSPVPAPTPSPVSYPPPVVTVGSP